MGARAPPRRAGQALPPPPSTAQATPGAGGCGAGGAQQGRAQGRGSTRAAPRWRRRKQRRYGHIDMRQASRKRTGAITGGHWARGGALGPGAKRAAGQGRATARKARFAGRAHRDQLQGRAVQGCVCRRRGRGAARQGRAAHEGRPRAHHTHGNRGPCGVRRPQQQAVSSEAGRVPATVACGSKQNVQGCAGRGRRAPPRVSPRGGRSREVAVVSRSTAAHRWVFFFGFSAFAPLVRCRC
jgi:hypothetical protein